METFGPFIGGILVAGFLYFLYVKLLAKKNKTSATTGGPKGGLKKK